MVAMLGMHSLYFSGIDISPMDSTDEGSAVLIGVAGTARDDSSRPNN
jgi:hypothetical protein